MSEIDYEQKPTDQQEPIDITADNHVWGTPSNERQLAKIVMTDFAKYAQKTEGWSGFRLYNKNYYDDTDGSGMHPSDPGVEATIETRSPSGQLYKAMMQIDEEAHNPIDRGEFPEDYLDEEDEEDYD